MSEKVFKTDFTKIVGSAKNIQWDTDGLELEETDLKTSYRFGIPRKMLLATGIAKKNGNSYAIDTVALREFVSEQLSSEFNYCHKGFDMTWRISKK